MTASRLVAVSVSLGGLEAVEQLLASMPAGFSAAVAIAQHRRPDSGSRLLDLLRTHSTLPVAEPDDKDPVEPGNVYLAPANYHLLIERGGSFALSTEAAVVHARPSGDVLLESAADVYGTRAIGVVLTSSSRDGAEGAAAVARAGGVVLVQDPATATSPVAPRAALELVPNAEKLSLERIATRLTSLCPPSREAESS